MKKQTNKNKLNSQGIFGKEQETAITLIALVVTIVVLLILAGITIQLVLTDGGIFSQASRSKEQTRIGELLEKFNMSEAVLATEKLGQTSLEEYIKKVQKEGYVVEAEKQEDGSYHVVSEDGYVFQVSIIEGTDTNDIVIEYIGKAGNLPPIIEVKNVTTNSIEIEVKRTDGASNIKYEYKKHGETTYQTATGTGNTCTYTGLENDTIYDIKVTITRDGKEVSAEQSIAIGKIPTGVFKLKSTTWASGKATVTVYHEETGDYRIEWQKQGETNWDHGEIGQKEVSIPNLNHGDMIKLRLGDGTSGGENDASISIIDDKEPQVATVTFSPTTAKIEENITATVTLADNESGIDTANSKYIFNKSSTPLGKEDTSLYTGGNFASTNMLTVKATSSGTWYLHVLSVDNAGNKKETVSSGIEITEKMKTDGSYNAEKGVNSPKLGSGMTAITWNGSSWVEPETDDEWYSYTGTDKKWANAKTSDGSMWVWIPRYAYQIASGYQSSTAGVINIKFLKGTTNEATDGTTSWNNASGQGNWNIHPAFTRNTAMGGWSDEIEGIWVAKFEASSVQGNSNNVSGDNVTTKTIQVKPGVESWRFITINNIFTNCENYNKSLNSHMMKNSEWGAVAYLSKSVYGKNDEITINRLYIAYTSNTAQSTTGNVYGIYDISGGSWEYVASYVNNGSSDLTTNGASLVNSSNTNLKQVYGPGSSDDREQHYQANKGKYGDAVYETSTAGTGSTSWYGDCSGFPYSGAPFFMRGGCSTDGGGAGAFAFYDRSGGCVGFVGFRPVLVAP